MTAQDNATIAMMEKFGGGFVRALAAALRLADPANLERIKTAFPEYWARYTALATEQTTTGEKP